MHSEATTSLPRPSANLLLGLAICLSGACSDSGDGGTGEMQQPTVVSGAAGTTGTTTPTGQTTTPTDTGTTPTGTPTDGQTPTDTGTGTGETPAGTDTGEQTPADTGTDTEDPMPPADDVPIGVTFPGELGAWCTGQPEEFSFFVTSMDALWALSASAPGDLSGGFGGDFGGIAGADAICQTIAQATGHGGKTWRAFLSATDDGSGNPVHAIERIGEGPWYDANGLLVATGLQGLLGDRPDGDPQTVEDLPDECGIPISALGDAHDTPTGSDKTGHLNSTDPASTCNDWTSTDASLGSGEGGGGAGLGSVMAGHTFPRNLGGGGSFGGGGGFGGANWMSDHGLRGCSKGANLIQNGAGEGTCIGCSGGFGGLYCFAAQ